jgi:monothiol glutaredoxin
LSRRFGKAGRTNAPCLAGMTPGAAILIARSHMDTQERIKQIVTGNPVVLFMKGTAQFPMCGFSGRAIQILKACGVNQPYTVNVLEDPEIRQGIKDFANWPTIPQLYVNGEFVGGSDIMMEMYESGELQSLFAAA